MAIPKFYSILKAQWPDVINDVPQDSKCDSLYLDMNSVLHICLSNSESKDEFLINVVEYLEKIVEVSNPQKLLYLAFDGVPPLAKLKGQAVRRRLHSNKAKSTILDPNSLTPGTQMMADLSKTIQEYMQRVFCRTHPTIEVIISDSSVPGEGEHKIIRHLRANSKHFKDHKYTIYGTDADLVVICLSLFESDILLIRESFNSRKNSTHEIQLERLNMSKLKGKLLNEYSKDTESVVGKNHIMLDILLVLSIIGNDFLPTPSGLTVDSTSLKLLLKTLREFHEEHKLHVVENDGTIAKEPFQKLFNKFLLYDLGKFKRDNPMKRSVLDSKILELQLSGLSLKDRKSKVSDKVKQLEMDYFSDWKMKYYKKALPIGFNNQNLLFQQYIRGLSWLIKYYVNECASWSWMNEYQIAPFLSDLSDGFKGCNLDFELGEPILPLHQLALVLPAKSKSLLPLAYQDSEIYHDFSSLLDTSKNIVNYSQLEQLLGQLKKEIDPKLTIDDTSRNLFTKDTTILPNE